jgi:hypothetical protein
MFWRVSKVLLGGLLVCSGVLSAAMLWVIFGFPLEPRRSDPDAARSRIEAANGASLSPRGTVNAAAPSRPEVGPMAEAPIQPGPSSTAAAAQAKPGDEATAQEPASSNQPPPVRPGAAPGAQTPTQPGAPSAAAAQAKPVEQAKADEQPGSNQPQPVRTETQDSGSAAGQQQISGNLTDQRAGMQCRVDLCAATYKSFNAADCTYQPYGGGPRSICALGAQPAVTHPQSLSIAAEPSPTADRAGPQCNRSLCAATYRSFNAADCTYEPYGGGPRNICAPGRGPADAPQQTARAATDAGDSAPDSRDSATEPDDMPGPGMGQETADSAMPDRAGPQCNRTRCAATYQSFHAADCTYQPEGGGPRRICEP